MCPFAIYKTLLHILVHHEESAQVEVGRGPLWMDQNDGGADAIERRRWQSWNVVVKHTHILHCQCRGEVDPHSSLCFLDEHWQVDLEPLHEQPKPSPVHLERQSRQAPRRLILTRQEHLEIDGCSWNGARDRIHDRFAKRHYTVPNHAGLELVQFIKQSLEVHVHGFQGQRDHALLTRQGIPTFVGLPHVWAVDAFLEVVHHPFHLQSEALHE
mmetsp:Transcript_16908/g.43049  ORF Transcript_16908/g.43049 Transcript_16908/m.43049 type:complete len:213 (-) Transcript_16908:219-857(-)